MTPAHPTSPSPDTPFSLASQLLQGDHHQTQIPATPNKPVGAGLPAMRPAQPASPSPDKPPSLASQLLQGDHLQTQIPGTPNKPVGAGLNWSSNPGHRLRCLCRFLLHSYWRQVVVVAVEPGAVVVHEEAHHVGFCFLDHAMAGRRGNTKIRN